MFSDEEFPASGRDAVYYARAVQEATPQINGDPLNNPDRATRAQVIRWKPDGTPDFGVPVADGPCP